MYVKNLSARLITVNAKGASTKLKPGSKEAVKLSKAQAETAFVASLIDRGELIEVAAPKDVPVADEKTALQEQLTGLGIEYDNRWGVDRLQKEIDEALAS